MKGVERKMKRVRLQVAREEVEANEIHSENTDEFGR